MIRTIVKLILFLGLIVIIGCNTVKTVKEDLPESLQIIPKPLQTEIHKGYFDISNNTGIENKDPELHKIIKDFAEKFDIKNAANNSSNTIKFELLSDSEKYGEEGYSLDISPNSIIVQAHKPAGIFYATQTIYQLSNVDLPKEYTGKIPCVKILDKPKFGWRGDMLDVSRHFLPMDLMKKNLDYLARYKMNVFHWHLTDDQGWRIEVKGYPELTKTGAWRVDRNTEEWWGRKPQQPGEKATYGGYFTQEEIKEIVQYAKDRYITIVPELDMPGHSQAIIAAYPEVSCDNGKYYVATGGVADSNTVCPGKEISFEFIEKMLAEVLPLFPGEYFHIGGDECNKKMWENCPDCQVRIKNEGLKDEHELQSYFIQRVEKIVNKMGKKLIGWDEILEGGLAENAAVMSWRGEAGGIVAAKLKHNVVMTPNSYCYLDLKQGDPELEPKLGYGELKLSTCYSYNPISDKLSDEEAKYVLGVGGNLWGESIQNETHMNYMLFPRLQAVAEVGWTPKKDRHWDDFVDRIEHEMKWMDHKNIGYAKSMYNVGVDIVKIEKGFGVKLSTEQGRVPIYYTTDGSIPTMKSKQYTKPLEITETTTIKTVAFIDDKQAGKIKTKDFHVHKAFGKDVKLATQPNPKYPGIADISLTDLMRGEIEFSGKQWMGFEAEDFEAMVDMGKSTTIESIKLGCLESQGKWIFLPSEVTVEISENGKDFIKIGSTKIENLTINNDPTIKNINVNISPVKARYIRISAKNTSVCPDWHKGAGGKAWLFVDEIIIQ